jgi:twitching motility protein PilT
VVVDAQAVHGWLEDVWQRGGTDLLLTVDAPPSGRVDGVYAPLDGLEPMAEADIDQIAETLLEPAQRAALRLHQQVDFSFTWHGNARVRGNAFHQRGAVAVALRIIPLDIPTLADLGAPPAVEQLASGVSGLVLLTGPTGAGKSTTLASLIDHVNRHRACHILTIEDPIEYVHRHKKSIVNQREVGVDATSFADALRAALREDPDVILVGEMRDLESIATTLTLAETGHLVFATLHTNDTAQALDRIVDVFPSDRRDQVQVQLSATLQGVIYQRLVPKIGGGMTAAYEVLVANNAVRNLVREGKTRQIRNVVATHQAEGMQTLEASLSELVASSVIRHEDAEAVSLHPKEIAAPKPAPPGGYAEEQPRRGRRRG